QGPGTGQRGGRALRFAAAGLLPVLGAACFLACSTEEASLGGLERSSVSGAGTGGISSAGAGGTGGAAGFAGSSAGGTSGSAGSGGSTQIACELSIYDVKGEWHGWSHKNGPATVWLKDDGTTFY